jgi:hypothetical protein
MPRFVRGLVLAGALVLAGCGAGGNDASTTAERPKITQAQLAAMVLPQGDLGTIAEGLELVADSGQADNAEAAAESPGPDDTGKSLGSAGRLDGHKAYYGGTVLVAAKKKAPVVVGTEVELLEDTVYAAQYLHKQVGDVPRNQGKQEDGTKVTVTSFPVLAVGDEAQGFFSTMLRGKQKLFGTVVVFRRGRVIGATLVIRPDKQDQQEEARALAVKLDKRIQDVLAGRLGPNPPAPVEDEETAAFAGYEQLPAATVSGRDVAPGASAVGEGRDSGDGFVSYYRVFEDIRMGSSHLIKLRVEARLYRSKAEARKAYRRLQTNAGRRSYGRELVGSITEETGLKAFDTQVVGLPAAGRDYTGIVVTFGSTEGSYRFTTVFTRSGKRIAAVTGFCHTLGLNPSDMKPLARKARNRLVA